MQNLKDNKEKQKALSKARHLMTLEDNSISRSQILDVHLEVCEILKTHHLRIAGRGDRYVTENKIKLRA